MKTGKIIASILGVFVISSLISTDVLAGSYLYNQENKAVAAPAVYTISKEIVLEADGVTALYPQDIFYGDSGKLYITDTDNNRILIYDEDYKAIGSLSTFVQSDGTMTTLNAPEGIYVDENDIIYIADTKNGRILKCDVQGNVLLQIDKPENMIGVDEEASFYPSKISVDATGRIYIVARNYNLGILQLDANGRFVGYIGAPKVQYNIIQMLWRKVSTQEQLDKMEQYVPTEYNNITIDDEGFIYGTISTLDTEDLMNAIETNDLSGTITPIKKLNTVGTDILKRNGFSAPLGDLECEEESVSRIIDVTYTDGGIWAMLDSANGHVFVYDSNGNLLCAFGNCGKLGEFSQVSSMSYSGDKLLILDSEKATIFVYELTDYGKILFDAVETQYNGDFEEAYTIWSDVAAYNYNFDYAFVGLGQTYLNDGQYEKAMECFQKVNDKENYSKAKELLRKENMKTLFPVIFISIIGIVVVVFLQNTVKKVYYYVKGEKEWRKS